MKYDDASKALVGLAASRHNAFHTNEADDINFKPQRLRKAQLRGEITALHPKVWAIKGLGSSPAQALRAATLSIPDSAASLRSAAWLHGWIEHPPPLPQVWHPVGTDRRRNQIDVHERSGIDPALDIDTVNWIPTLNKAATLCFLGRVADKLTVERCLDEFLRTESRRWLFKTMKRLHNVRCAGSRCLAEILGDPLRVDGVPDSWLERVTAKLLASEAIPPIEFQHSVTIEGHTFRLDLAIPELKLGLEFHSRQFHWGPAKEDADNNRDWLLTSAGWQVLYVTYSDIMSPEDFVRLFALTVEQRSQLDFSDPHVPPTGSRKPG